MKKKFLITSALPYANGPLHFGHIAGAYLPGDCYARFRRLNEDDVLYLCGSDEYGIAITLSAELAKRTPKEHVDIFHSYNKALFEQLGISFDHYSRTTWSGHVETTQNYFLDLKRNGWIEEKVTDELFSEKDNRFLADRYVIGTCPKCGFKEARGDECPSCGASYEAIDLIEPKSKLTNSPLVKKATKHWFLLLDKMKDRLEAWVDSKNWKPNVVNFVKSYIKDLRPRAITRDSDWGISIPLSHTEGKVLYVWFDAPIGYISAAKEWAELQGDAELWKKYWCDQETTLIHFIGKDNIPFHGVIFPAMTMGQDLPLKLVDELPANEFYNLEGRQFSKSDGWYIDLEDFFKKYSVDQIRYAIASNAPESSDAEFTWKDFQSRSNAELLGKYGNLVNRVMVFAHNRCGGVVPVAGELLPEDKEFFEKLDILQKEIKEAYSHFKLRRASQLVMEIAHLGNTYFDHMKPWVLAKSEGTYPRMHTVIANCFECLKVLAVVSSPIIPHAAEKIWSMLGFEGLLSKASWKNVIEHKITPSQRLQSPVILFRKIEDAEIDLEIGKLQELSKKSKKMQYPPLKPEITFDDISKVDLRVVKILEAEPVPKSKKLLKLRVDLGFEERTVVSGISQHYTPEQLVGKKVILVANLKPATLMGVESHGMILAGSDEESLEVINIDKVLPGHSVH